MSWRTFDKFTGENESLNVQWFRVGPSGSFESMQNVTEMAMNAHSYLNDNMYKIFAKYLFMCNDKATVIQAFFVDDGNFLKASTKCLVFIGYEPKNPSSRAGMFFGAGGTPYCGKAIYETSEHSTTIEEIVTDSMPSSQMPGEAFRAYRHEFKLKQLKLME